MIYLFFPDARGGKRRSLLDLDSPWSEIVGCNSRCFYCHTLCNNWMDLPRVALILQNTISKYTLPVAIDSIWSESGMNANIGHQKGWIGSDPTSTWIEKKKKEPTNHLSSTQNVVGSWYICSSKLVWVSNSNKKDPKNHLFGEEIGSDMTASSKSTSNIVETTSMMVTYSVAVTALGCW